MSKAVSVKVVVRCRPLSRTETANGANICAEIDEAAHTIKINDPSGTVKQAKTFTFDHTYSLTSTQQQVYDDIGQPVIQQALDGYNSTIFAYGQTGSGKTHTMMGSGDDHGIIPKMNDALFLEVNKLAADDLKFLLTVSYLEIYNEVVKDLLNPSDQQLKIREHPKMGIYVESLAELVVSDSQGVQRLLDQGNSVRRVAATNMNERSSRSHSCFCIKVQQKKVEINEADGTRKETALNAKINLVDLAGSERAEKTGATGDRLKEGAAINKSLSALGSVINHLAEGKNGHIPYRDSKLTRLLQESLGGNAMTVMVAALSPADYHYDETLGTVRYAYSAKSIKNQTKRNEDVNQRMIRELRGEIDELREQLALAASGKGGSGMHGDDDRDKMEEMEEKIANLERAKHEGWEEKQKLAHLYEEQRSKNMEDENHIRDMMQTMKEEKMEAIVSIKKLQSQRMKLSKGMRAGKLEYAQLKAGLEGDMKTYQELLNAPEGDANNDLELQKLLPGIEAKRSKLVSHRDYLASIKSKLQEIDTKLTEERAEIAAQTALLEADSKMREKIQLEERKKLEAEKDAFLESALGQERERLQLLGVTEEQKRKLEERFATKFREEDSLLAEAELTKLDLQSKNNLLALELERVTKENAKLRQTVAETDSALRDVIKVMQKEKNDSTVLLAKALTDLQYLSTANSELEKKYKQAIMWEPDC